MLAQLIVHIPGDRETDPDAYAAASPPEAFGAHSGHRSTARSTSQTCSTGASTSILVLCSTGPSCSCALLETGQDQVPHTSCTVGFRNSW